MEMKAQGSDSSTTLEAALYNIIRESVSDKLSLYGQVIDKLENKEEIDEFSNIYDLKSAVKSKFQNFMVNSFYVGEQIVKGVTQDLGVLMKIEKSLRFKEAEENKKEEGGEEESSKYVIQESSLILSHLKKNTNTENKDNIPNYVLGLTEETFIDPVEGYQAYINKNFLQDCKSNGFRKLQKDEAFFDSSRIYHSFVLPVQNSLYYCSVDGEVHHKTPFTKFEGLSLFRVVFTPNEQVYIIGGAKEGDYTEITDNVYKFTPKIEEPVRMSNMITARASFGCILHLRGGTIYVVGGDKGVQTQTHLCEEYCLLTDRWSPLPSIGEVRSNMGLCVFEEEFLYAFGGMCKLDGAHPVQNVIERLNIKAKLYWERVHVELPNPICDIGLIQLGSNMIFCFGGWNHNPVDDVYMIKIEPINHILINYKKFKLGSPDSFASNGAYHIESDGMRICGREGVHQINISTMDCRYQQFMLKD